MATVMKWGNSEGTKGRCDAKCHNATKPDCDCMCGGRYHGVGEGQKFRETAREHGLEILKAAEQRAAAEGITLEDWSDGLFSQLALFDRAQQE